jgi:hypothetical protein
MKKVILSLCDHSGVWSEPYREAGDEYEVRQVDIDLDGSDVRLMTFPGKVHGIIAQPPCTHFAMSGQGWWKTKGVQPLLEGLAIADACLRIVAVTKPEWWVLENPIGRLKNYLGEPQFRYQPYDFAGLADNPEGETYSKQTLLWGTFTPPLSIIVGETTARKKGSVNYISNMPESADRTRKRSQTPQGFARAFFRCNP